MAIIIILAYKIKNIDNNLKQKIANLTFVDDGTIYTMDIDKEIEYKDENSKKQKLPIKQKLILTYKLKLWISNAPYSLYIFIQQTFKLCTKNFFDFLHK